MAGRRRALANDDPRLTPFARTLRALISARGLSDTRLCLMAGLPPSTLSRWISYTRRPTNLGLLLQTAATLELTRDEIEDLMNKAGYDLDAVLQYRMNDLSFVALAERWRHDSPRKPDHDRDRDSRPSMASPDGS